MHCAVFCFDTCLRYKSFVKVVDKQNTPVNVWEHMKTLYTAYTVTRFPVHLDEQPTFFKDFIDTIRVQPDMRTDKPCDMIIFLYTS